MEYVVVYVTVSNRAEGEKIAKALLNRKLAACVNIVDGVQSHYWWQGKLEVGAESLLIIKTKKGILGALYTAVKENHSYSVPEIIAMPIVAGSEEYLKWIDDSMK
ncbi:MAG TPA: divalent-cation tolerance protein CutA [bacterium]|nr:divalent-cation tolerance protein CutA [bacterium]